MKARQVRGDNDTVTIVATEAITAKRLVTTQGAHTAGKAAVGVALFATDSGDNISVGCGVIEVVESGGVIAADGPVKSDANGKAVATGGSGITVGYALDAATAAGEFIRILLQHGGNS